MYAHADLRLCWSHIPHCWKSDVAAHIVYLSEKTYSILMYLPILSAKGQTSAIQKEMLLDSSLVL